MRIRQQDDTSCAQFLVTYSSGNSTVGAAVVGAADGERVGLSDGDAVGIRVGAYVNSSHTVAPPIH